MIDVNRRSAYAMSEVDLGRAGLATSCEIMNLPQPVADCNFQDYNKATMEICDEKLQEAASELRTQMADDPGINAQTVLDVAVSFDGSWSKRGFTADYGVGFVIAPETGKVLDYTVLSKVCEVCKQSNRFKNDSKKLEQWQQNHKYSGECQKNFNGSSSAMEKEAAKNMWNHSVEKHKLRYTTMVCDGDSKAHAEVWDSYKVCEEHSKYERMDKKKDEYKTWIDSDAFKKWESDHESGKPNCNRVNKLDCIGHVQKRMDKNLLNMTKEKKLADGKPVGGRSGQLTRSVIDKLQKYYGNAIRSTVDRTAKTKVQVDKVIANMQQAIKAVLYHSTKLSDAKERHQFCPKGLESWYAYQRDIVTGHNTFQDKDHYLDAVFLNFLSPLFNRLSETKFLKEMCTRVPTKCK